MFNGVYVQKKFYQLGDFGQATNEKLPTPRLELRCGLDVDLASWQWIYRLVFNDVNGNESAIDIATEHTYENPVASDGLYLPEGLDNMISSDSLELGIRAFGVYGARIFQIGFAPVTNAYQILEKAECLSCISAGRDQSLMVGVTDYGLQVWCKNCDKNVLHIDFQGRRHPVVFG